MEIISLKPPQPRKFPLSISRFDFKIGAVISLPKIQQHRLPPLHLVLDRRQSRREFKTPLAIQKLSDLLWHSSRVRQIRRTAGNVEWQSRPSPSGGGCHPIQLLLLRAPVLETSLLIYNPEHHALGVRELPSDKFLQKCIGEVENCLKINHGTVFWFVADLARSGAKYRNPESLAWRDSGALLATISLVAESLALECCGLGIHDIPSLRKLLQFDQSIIGVGGCIIS